MALGAAISNNHNYYPYPAWGYHGIYYGGRPYYPPPYRPAYPGYRPAYGYHPPSNYRWTQVNRNVNVSNNYYNRFNNQNRPSTLPANTRAIGNTKVNAVNTSGLTRRSSTYQGAHPATGQQRPGASMANAVPRNQQFAASGNQSANLNRPSPSNHPASSVVSPSNRAHPGNAPPVSRGGDRGYATPAPSSTGTARAASTYSPNLQEQNRSDVGRVGAFGGGSARTERAASSRGRSSMGASGGLGNRRGR
jgi:hypothetical protein